MIKLVKTFVKNCDGTGDMTFTQVKRTIDNMGLTKHEMLKYLTKSNTSKI